MRLQSVNYLEQVAQFMYKHKQTIRIVPAIPESMDERTLRVKLIAEEAEELINAIRRDDLVEIADGIAGLLYVTFGTALTYGLPIESLFMEVHKSNMSKPKLGHDDAGVKVPKGTYRRPQLAAIIQSVIDLAKKPKT
jgi:predicted HAD superfamily Cof-like phosphohydrolase